ncbi:MAG: Na(+)/H(+) antiporter subunit D [Paracidovorax wautersii]|uniref:Na(+)/H(+) antiporter subunit D n=1 Tax=Paracidovorax wautersii TaxID=1177982 RepID=A0A7V8FMH2_9BURK|nr:MAG: Na(+)/H(+) antiporter subunit D [Paracidovorax wautersii]
MIEELAQRLMPHLVVAPILLPMLTAALLLFLQETQQRLKAQINVASILLGLVLSCLLLVWVKANDAPVADSVYLAGNWQAPFGIVLVADRLAALMLVLTSTIALCGALFAASRWDRAGVHFHPLFQLQLMGLAGAFLTGDLFNLFVFFEIMLAASYGLMLHGSGRARVSAGMHYVVINLIASSVFLIGVAMLYSVTGTLNMADMAARIPQVAAGDRPVLHAASAILAVAFLVKAGMWPLNFWLVPGYSNATPPVGALFAIMTKVGVYTMLRLSTLMFSPEAGPSADFGGDWIIYGGLATLAFASVGMIGSQKLGNMAGYAVIVSSGTLLAAVGFGREGLTGGALYYLLSSTLAASAFFLMTDVIERWRNDGASIAGFERDDVAPFLNTEFEPQEGVNLDEEEEALIGRPIPAATAFLGLGFICVVLLVAGLPPLSGFVGKVAMLSALLNPHGLQQGASVITGTVTMPMVLLALLILSGLCALIAMSRAGIRHFWAVVDRGTPKVRLAEGLPIAALLLACITLAVKGDPVLRYTHATAQALHDPSRYIHAVLSKEPRPGKVSQAPADPDPQPARATPAPAQGATP